jgi:hypothetical protein
MANFNISNFKTRIAKDGGLSRGVFFNCQISHPNPNFPFTDDLHSLLCKAANLPSATLDPIELKYFTRSVKVPGSRQFAPVTLTFYNTQSYSVRNIFLKWLSVFNTPVTNVRNAIDMDETGGSVITRSLWNTNNYATITLASRDEQHNELGLYRFAYAFPSSVSGVQYSYENDGQVQTYDVEVQYLHATFTPIVNYNMFP